MSEDSRLLEHLVDVRPVAHDSFRTEAPHVVALGRVFGGQVAAQALLAAGQTIDDPGLAPHSLHSYFLRPGDPNAEILFEVDKIRDGRSFATRRVVATQHGQAIFNLQCSFHIHEEGHDHQDSMPAGPNPSELAAPGSPDWPGWPGFDEGPGPAGFGVDLRYCDSDADGDNAGRQVWIRALAVPGDDPLVNAAVLAYVADLTILAVVMVPHGGRSAGRPGFAASLDHCVWLHRRASAKGWLLYDQHTPSASGALGLATGRLFNAEGVLIASVAQEGLIRPSLTRRVVAAGSKALPVDQEGRSGS